MTMMEQTILDYLSAIVDITVETNIPAIKWNFAITHHNFVGVEDMEEKLFSLKEGGKT